MAVISVIEQDGREVERSQDMNVTDTRRYRIDCDVPNDTEANVLIGSGMPLILAPHPDSLPPVNDPRYAGLRCVGASVKQRTDSDPFVWNGTVKWARVVFGRKGDRNVDPEKRNENPLLRPAILYFGTERFQVAARRDKDGKAVVNSAGDPFEQGVMRPDFRPTLTITKNLSSFNLATWKRYVNTVNITDFLGEGPGSVLLVNWTARDGYEGGIKFFECVWDFHFASEFEGDWDPRPLDCGYQKLDAGKKKEILLPGGTKPASPVLLDGHGGVLPVGGTPVYLDFPVHKFQEFNDLHIF